MYNFYHVQLNVQFLSWVKHCYSAKKEMVSRYKVRFSSFELRTFEGKEREQLCPAIVIRVFDGYFERRISL